ncbi:hypothetical protein ACHAPA_010039 [Fusarium lateritium]
MPEDLYEDDLIAGEFSFDDVFEIDKDADKVYGRKTPEVLLQEIDMGVKKAIAKVGM